MAISDRGFASMDKAKVRLLAGRGGRAAHRKGTAHVWTAGPEAQAAGRKGGLAPKRPRRAPAVPDEEETS